MTGWGRKFDLQLLPQCGSTYICQSRSVPEIHKPVAGTLSNQQTNISTSKPFRACLRYQDGSQSRWLGITDILCGSIKHKMSNCQSVNTVNLCKSGEGWSHTWPFCLNCFICSLLMQLIRWPFLPACYTVQWQGQSFCVWRLHAQSQVQPWSRFQGHVWTLAEVSSDLQLHLRRWACVGQGEKYVGRWCFMPYWLVLLLKDEENEAPCV